ncbi:MAG: hypothetical protein KBF12_08850 [Sebaldella sp.]|nr:hypothetical protein [Sebaldella sp.]
MKKVYLFLVLALSSLSVSDINIVPDDSFGKSIFYSGLVIAAPIYLSAHTSQEVSSSKNYDENRTVEETYKYFKNLAQKGEKVRADEVFSTLGLENVGLKNEDMVELTEINVGMLVSNKYKSLALIPSNAKYEDLMGKKIR